MYLNRVAHFSRQIFRNMNGVTGLRSEDVWLTSFPRSGNSWIRIILANIIHLAEKEGEEVDLRTLAYLLPSFGFANLHLPWQATVLPRFVKTHHPFRYPFFCKPSRSVLLIRDPRDAVLSYYDLAQKSKIIAYEGEFTDFLRHPKYGLPAWIRHYQSWESRATMIVKYEDLRNNPAETLNNTFIGLSLNVEIDVIEKAVERSAIDRMREKEAETGLRNPERFRSDFQAVRTGSSRNWEVAYSDSDLDYYQMMLTNGQWPNYESIGESA